jgi:hypothetical protein
MDHELAWLHVPGYEGIYQISSLGEVRRIGKQHGAVVGRFCRWRTSRAQYPVVQLSRNSVCRKHFVHRLVAAAFLGPCPEGFEVNHKDRDR